MRLQLVAYYTRNQLHKSRRAFQRKQYDSDPNKSQPNKILVKLGFRMINNI